MGLHLIPLLIHSGHRAGALLIGDKAIHKGLPGVGRRVIRAEVQSEEYRLDPDVIQAVPLLHLPLHGLHDGIQQGEAVTHLLDVCLILRRGSLRDGPAVEAQVHHSAVVLRPS